MRKRNYAHFKGSERIEDNMIEDIETLSAHRRSQRAPDATPQAQVHNLVGTAKIDTSCTVLNLRAISRLIPNCRFDKQKFAAITIRIRNPMCTVLLFTRGKMVLTGCRTYLECIMASHEVVSMLRRSVPGTRFLLKHVSIQNIVGKVDLSFSLSHSLSLSLSLGLSIYVSIYLVFCLSLSGSVSLCFCLSLSFPLSLFLYVSLPRYVSFALFLYCSQSMSLSLSFSTSLCLYVNLCSLCFRRSHLISLSLSLSLADSLSLSVSVFSFLSLSVSLPFSLSLSLFLSLSFSLSLTLILSVSLSHLRGPLPI